MFKKTPTIEFMTSFSSPPVYSRASDGYATPNKAVDRTTQCTIAKILKMLILKLHLLCLVPATEYQCPLLQITSYWDTQNFFDRLWNTIRTLLEYTVDQTVQILSIPFCPFVYPSSNISNFPLYTQNTHQLLILFHITLFLVAIL